MNVFWTIPGKCNLWGMSNCQICTWISSNTEMSEDVIIVRHAQHRKTQNLSANCQSRTILCIVFILIAPQIASRKWNWSQKKKPVTLVWRIDLRWNVSNRHRTEAYKKTIALQTFYFWSCHVLAPFVLRHSQYTDKGLKKSQVNYTNKNKNRLLVACLQCVYTGLLCTVCCICSVSGGFSFSRSVPRKYF